MSRFYFPISLVLAFLGASMLAAFVLYGPSTLGWGYDFHAYYDAAQRLATTGSPYQTETLSGPYRPGPFGLYLYSPALALVLRPLASLALADATMVWVLARIALLGATCALLPVPRWVRLASFGAAALSGPFLYDLSLGNVSVIVTFLAVVSWRSLDRPTSGLALAANLAIRPTMAVIGVWWLLRRQWRPVAWTAVGYLGLAAVSLLFAAPTVWLQYLTVLRNLSDVTGVKRNLDIASTLAALNFPPAVAQAGLLAGFAIAVAAILLSLRRDRDIGFVVTATASLLLAPLLWDHYMTLLLLPGALLAARGRRWAVLLPLAGWLPDMTMSIVAVAATLLPFLAHDSIGQSTATRPTRRADWPANAKPPERPS